MSHPNSQGNGCSLEDCHTNLFALTDLDGIKWRRLSAENVFFLDPLEDPVLQSFTKCIQADVLCVWRRVQRSSDQRASDQLTCNKELCIFWYGEEPQTLSSLLSPELQEVETGAWDQGGLTYECRTLLFKALHNLIERCLLSQNFVRVGRWFVQPCEAGNNSTFTDKGMHLSIRFSFFLHGESQVCASIDVRQHTPLRRLQPFHIQYAQNGTISGGVNVILAPYGLSGVLTGVTYKDTDMTTQRLLDEWRQFYVIKDCDMREAPEGNRVPPAVEVIVAGVRMRYPSTFVLVTADIENEVMGRQNTSITGHVSHQLPAPLPQANLPLTPPTSPMMYGSDTALKGPLPPPEEVPVTLGGSTDIKVLSQRIIEKVWEDDSISAGNQPQRSERHHTPSSGGDLANSDDSVAVWDIHDPTAKTSCACSKGKGGKCRTSTASSTKPGLQNVNKHMKGGEKAEKTTSRHSRPSLPFHRRSGLSDPYIQGEADLPLPRVPPSFGSFKGPTPSNTALPQLTGKTNFEQSLDSPASAAPSPLVATTKEPSMSQNVDPTMPTLSPQRLPPPGSDAPPLTNGEAHSNEPLTTTEPTQPTGDGYTKPPSASAPNRTTEGNHLPSPFQPAPNSVGVPTEGVSKTETVSNWLEQQQKHQENQGIKRPLLPTKNYDDVEDDGSSEALYDFDSLQAWLDQPIKRHKFQDSQQDSGKGARDHAMGLANGNGGSQMSRLSREAPPTPPTTVHDPYEFSEESSTNMGSFSKRLSFNRSKSGEENFPRSSFGSKQDEPSSRRSSDSSFGIKDDPDMSPPPVDTAAVPPGTLLREQDLKPNVTDLDKLFESSDSENGESDTFQVPTPPGLKTEDTKSVCTKEVRPGPTDMIGPTPTELSVMYPTPPSMDNAQATSSPGTGDPAPDQTIINDQVISRIDTISMFSEETIKDWTFVYKPPQQAMLPNAPRYAPIELPSSRLTPINVSVHYKPSWMYQPLPMIEKHQHTAQTSSLSHYPNVSSVEQSNMAHKSDRLGGHVEAPSPATFLSTNQRTPMSYELQSPASNASSYLNKNMSSVDNTHTNSQMPEVHSLAVNIMLSDSVLNIYKDHNFDSCTMCVCNMNIKGADMGVYITDKSNEAQYRCTCGFSAIINRKYGARSGLFYEDEVDITDIRDERLEQKKARLLSPELLAKDTEGKLPTDINEAVLIQLRLQFSTLFPSSTVLHNYYKQRVDMVSQSQEINLLDLQDGCEACYMALEAGRQVMENCSSQKLEDPLQKATCLHKWPFVLEYAIVPSNSQVVVRLLKSLQPLLQDTIQKKRGTMFWESVYTVSGPLTWKDFHLLAGRGAEEASEPQPIPSVIVGYEKEWLSVSPYTFSFWDKLLLEPYAKQRDVAYIVVAPDNDFILTQLLGFFKELSTIYELLKLGRHCPISKTLRDGIMRVGKKAAQKVADKPVDDWFTFLGNSPVAAKLKLYAQVCRHRLAPYLETQAVDESLFEGVAQSTTRSPPKPHPEPSPQPSTPQDGQPATPSSEEKGEGESSSTQKEATEPELPEQDGADCPAVVIYMIDPFTYGADWDDLRRLSMIGLLRCYQEILAGLQENVHMQNNIQLQLVPLQAVLDFRETSTMPFLKQLAMSVYTQCRRNMIHTVLGRSLTGFGPASSAEKLLKSITEPKPVFTPPFILAPFRERQLQLTENTEHANVLFCGYCLSEDQRWLLTAVTDDKGELLETCAINIEIPNRNRRKKASARKIGLAKLWDFILDLLSMTTQPWRLVIGRFGKMGHGELIGWAGLLSRNNLIWASKQLRKMCNQCNTVPNHETPCIVAACLVSMEIHNSIHIMTDSVKAEEKRSSNIPLSTPKDASCTHILVFPTSSTAQPSASVPPQENIIDIDPDLPTDIGDDPIFDDFENMGNFDFLLGSPGSPGGSPKNNEDNGMCVGGDGGRNSPNGAGTARQLIHDPQDDDKPNLLQQPLAMGFYASTAPSGPIPRWFWSSCPHRQNMCPLCFRAALHIHCTTVQQNQEEFTHNTHTHNSHPLDSTFTCDVLRYVLETYNALSWLTMDPQTNERRSCLPAHFMVLMQLYHAMDAFV